MAKANGLAVNTLSENKTRIKNAAGLSLLEVILVLAFMGIVLLAIATYAKKVIDEKKRQLAADAIAQDVSGLLKFINTDTIEATVIDKTGKKTDTKVVNPLYQQKGEPSYLSQPAPAEGKEYIEFNPLTQIHGITKLGGTVSWRQPLLPYVARTWAKRNASSGKGASYSNPINNNEDPIGNIYSQPLRWSENLWNKDKSMRQFFTDSSCSDKTDPRPGIYFKQQQFLSCTENVVLKNSEISMPRVDLISSKGSRLAGQAQQSVGIDRVDVYIRFNPDDHKTARIGQYIEPLLEAFKNQKITPNNGEIYLVKQDPNDALKWNLVDVAFKADSLTPGGERPAKFSDLVASETLSELKKGGIFGLRFTFDGKGDFLRTDGSNAATKVCWNSASGKAGPCIQAEDNADNLLTLKKRNSTDFGNLQLASVVLESNHIDPDTKKVIVDERYTAPRILYRSFTNHRLSPTYNDPNNKGKVCLANGTSCNQPPFTIPQLAAKDNGAIELPIQNCPSAVNSEGKKIPLYPRLSAAVSSASSTLLKNADGTVTYDVPPKPGIKDIEKLFSLPATNLDNLIDQSRENGISINRLGGVVLQIIQDEKDATNHSGYWRIVSVMSIEDTNASTGHTWQYYNPPWLSVMITSWCSVKTQDEVVKN